MNNFLYRHAPITPCSGNVKIQEIVPFTRKQDVFKSKRVLFPMSQKIIKISNLTESYEGDILKKKQQKEYWLPSMSDVTSSELGYMLYTSQKLSTLGSWLIIGEFWPIIHVRLYIKCLSIYSIYEDFCGFSVTLGTAPTLIWKHLASLLMKQSPECWPYLKEGFLEHACIQILYIFMHRLLMSDLGKKWKVSFVG